MPRPKNGYTNAAGQPVPGTNDITGRYKDYTFLMNWAWAQGRAGKPRYERSALDIGSVVHAAIDRFMRGAQKAEIHILFMERLLQEAHREAAYASFRAFLEWHEQCEVTPIEQEVSLVSEPLQYGGTPDLIALIRNRVGIIDFKTSKDCSIYPDQKVALRAHANLWNEHNAKFKIATYHLIGLSKEGSGFKHHEFADLDAEWTLFQLYRKAYDLDLDCAAAQPSKARAKTATQSAAKISDAMSKPKPRAKPQPAASLAEVIDAADFKNHVSRPEHQLSMAELLRGYGHVPSFDKNSGAQA
jgi:hypothetical protein